MNTQENKGPPGAGLRRYRHFFPKGTQTCYRCLCENPQNDRGFRRLKVEIRDYSFLALEASGQAVRTPEAPRCFGSGRRRACPLCWARRQLKTRPGPTGTQRGGGSPRRGAEPPAEVMRAHVLPPGTCKRAQRPRENPERRGGGEKRRDLWRTEGQAGITAGPPRGAPRGLTPRSFVKTLFPKCLGRTSGLRRRRLVAQFTAVCSVLYSLLFFQIYRIHPHGVQESESGQWQRPIFSSQTTQTS